MKTAPRDMNSEGFGDWLRGFRASRRLSVSGAAKRAGLSRSTLLRWESGSHLPRLPELEAFLEASGATAAQRNEALVRIGAPRAARALLRAGDGSTEEEIPLVSGGDLLRAMRLRRGWTQERLATSVGVTKSVVSRWESAEAILSPNRLSDLTEVLGAHPQECAALATGSLLSVRADPFPHTPPYFEAVDHAIVMLEMYLKRHPDDPLNDLRYLSLKARILPDARRHPRMRNHLAHGDVVYASYLLAQGRIAEARRVAGRALEIGLNGLDPDLWWAWAVEFLAQGTARMGEKAAALQAVEILDLWKDLPGAIPHSDGSIGVYLQRHKSLYLSQAGRHDAALESIRQTKKIALGRDYYDEIHGCGIYEGRILFRAGRFNEAVDALPLPRILWADTDVPAEVLKEQLVRAEALLAVNERSEAQHWLSEAQVLLDDHNVGPLRHQWETLVERINACERGHLTGRHLAEREKSLQLAPKSATGTE